LPNVVLDMAMSLDGFIAGPNDEDDGLHNYFFSPVGPTKQVIEEGFRTTGTIIMGRRSYDVGAAQDGFADNPQKSIFPVVRSWIKMNQQDLGTVARNIIDSMMYMVLGTADASGQPWASPVYFASEDYTHFYWVSSPEVRHSRNIAIRPQVSIVVFDSRAPIGTGQGVYMSAVAEELTAIELERGIEIFSRTSLRHGGRAWSPQDVQPPALYRLYRATAQEHWVLDPGGHPDHRISVNI
jgi:hypothetical protein